MDEGRTPAESVKLALQELVVLQQQPAAPAAAAATTPATSPTPAAPAISSSSLPPLPSSDESGGSDGEGSHGEGLQLAAMLAIARQAAHDVVAASQALAEAMKPEHAIAAALPAMNSTPCPALLQGVAGGAAGASSSSVGTPHVLRGSSYRVDDGGWPVLAHHACDVDWDAANALARNFGDPAISALLAEYTGLLQEHVATAADEVDAWVAMLQSSTPGKPSRTLQTVLRRCFMLMVLALTHPHAMDPDLHGPLFTPLWSLLYKLPRAFVAAVAGCWATADTATLSKAVEAVQQWIILRLYMGSVAAKDMAPAVFTLSVLYEANERSRSAVTGRRLPLPAFYNDVVSQEIDLVADFRRWKMAARAAAAAEAGVPPIFSFCSMPAVLDAAAKQTLLGYESQVVRQTSMMREAMSRGIMQRVAFGLPVRRDHLLEDTLNAVVNVEDKRLLKLPLRVEFEGEAGVDEGGVKKELFSLVMDQLLSPEYGMVREVAGHTWFNPDSLESIVKFELIGSLCGLAIYNGVLLPVRWPLPLLRVVTDGQPDLADLATWQPEIARSLAALLEYPGDDVEDVFGLTWAGTYESWGELTEVELVPGGASKPVTSANRSEYVQAYVRWLCYGLVQRFVDAFKRGFLNVAQSDALQMFTPEELGLLITGTDDLNTKALADVTQYEEPFAADTPVVQWFWQTIHELPATDKRAFLKWATGTGRAPIRGLKDLKLKITRAGPDTDHLPTVHTCFNHILLPEYSSAEKTAEKVKLAIVECEGFGLM